MIKRSFSFGYLSLVISLLLLSLLSCLIILTELTHLYYSHVQSSRDHLIAYASALSGLRLTSDYHDHVTATLIESPVQTDFDSLPFFNYQGISFKLLQTPFFIYAYGTYNNVHCILHKDYP